MQRLSILFLALAASAGAAAAQPAPDPAAPAAPDPGAQPAPVAPPAEPATPPVAPPVVAPPPEAKPAEDMPKKVAVGKDSKGAFFTPGLLLQGWFINDSTTGKDASGNDTSISTLSTFRIRRAEISLSGEMIPKFLKYKVMFDPSRVRDTLTTATAVNAAGGNVTVSTPVSALSTLQDFYITFQSSIADVSLGQFKIPVSWEGFNSSAKLLMPERAFTSNLLGDKRDLGLRIEKTFEKVGYVAGIYNGNALNNFDNNPQKDLSLRLEVYPVKGLTIAGMAYGSVGYRTRAGTKDRFEGDVRFDSGDFLIQAEFIRAHDVRTSDAQPGADGKDCIDATAGKCDSQGGYVAVAYTLKDLGDGDWKGNLQPVVRFGFWDNDLDHDAGAAAGSPDAMLKNQIERLDYEVGLNYYLRNHEAKLQVSYDRQQFKSAEGGVTRNAVNEFILACQTWF
jgi:hypothetical protein